MFSLEDKCVNCRVYLSYFIKLLVPSAVNCTAEIELFATSSIRYNALFLLLYFQPDLIHWLSYITNMGLKCSYSTSSFRPLHPNKRRSFLLNPWGILQCPSLHHIWGKVLKKNIYVCPWKRGLDLLSRAIDDAFRVERDVFRPHVSPRLHLFWRRRLKMTVLSAWLRTRCSAAVDWLMLLRPCVCLCACVREVPAGTEKCD